ncbi:MAG TPA: carboxypeptidase regulatory-like domain-containing protein [Longimicrobium sp.]|nr:carboxypeptidase regulatory-like domain-containing protein [Longimicrobium sp.]
MNRITRLLLPLLAVVAWTASSAAAQRATVRGTVVDAQTGRGVPGATVHLGDDHSAVADEQGRFEIRRVRPGTQTVWARGMGYGLAASELEVPQDSITVELAIDPDPVQLEALVATVNRFDLRTRAYPHAIRVFRERDLATSAAGDMREFVQWRAGMRRVVCTEGRYCVSRRGRIGEPVVYIDEMRLLGGMNILSVYRPWEISRVEVYNGGAQVRVYTKSFIDWAARNNYRPIPLHLAI